MITDIQYDKILKRQISKTQVNIHNRETEKLQKQERGDGEITTNIEEIQKYQKNILEKNKPQTEALFNMDKYIRSKTQ